ncbi:MAG: electron transfer flavoprotein subunit alpha/FixB family protein [Anaerolineales bacterium]|jgi:electron transfer flavoprotein alpha subunit
MSGVLIYSEVDEQAFPLIAWAKSHEDVLGPVAVAVLGEDSQKRCEAHQRYGAAQLYVNEDEALGEMGEEVLTSALAQISKQAGADLILLAATRRGRSLASRLADALDAGCVSEAIEIAIQDGRLVTGRYALGGNTVAQEAILTPQKVIAVTVGTVDTAEPGDAAGEIIVAELDLPSTRTSVVERRPKPASAVNIAESERLVCVGRGLEKQDDLPIVEELAQAFSGEVACTRPLSAEYYWVPEERMIGISGEKVSPECILSLGVSGQVQHTVGIMGAKTIVAVNNDANAAIFKLADYGIVGDLYELVPALVAALKARSTG